MTDTKKIQHRRIKGIVVSVKENKTIHVDVKSIKYIQNIKNNTQAVRNMLCMMKRVEHSLVIR